MSKRPRPVTPSEPKRLTPLERRVYRSLQAVEQARQALQRHDKSIASRLDALRANAEEARRRWKALPEADPETDTWLSDTLDLKQAEWECIEAETRRDIVVQQHNHNTRHLKARLAQSKKELNKWNAKSKSVAMLLPRVDGVGWAEDVHVGAVVGNNHTPDLFLVVDAKEQEAILLYPPGPVLKVRVERIARGQARIIHPNSSSIMRMMGTWTGSVVKPGHWIRTSVQESLRAKTRVALEVNCCRAIATHITSFVLD